ncbi:MAG TPA: porin [Janthinobacterium sp.]|nr:porin [Janthinobacterium sp.]
MKKTAIATACLLALGISNSASADNASDIEALKQQMLALQKQNQQQMQDMRQMQEKINALSAAPPQAAQPTVAAAQQAPAAAPLTAAQPAAAPDAPLTTHIGGAELTLYGMADLSADSGKNGRQHLNQVSSNESFLGVRGGKDLGSTGFRAIFQIETMAEISGTPTAASAVASRNSFAGIEGHFGRIMLGKFDAPYKRATAAMDPFAASLGDYNAIMGNSAGEGRAEFDDRLPHAIAYESPNIGGFSFSALFSPGQKLDDLPAASNNAFPQGELVCSGSQQTSLNGATPNTAGTQTLCNDGAFKNAWSAALTYVSGPLLATVDWEMHDAANRTSDAGGIVSNESAAKVGLSYSFPIGNRVSAIYEKLYRNGGINPAQNERARSGYYFSDVQDLSHDVDLMGAWAHAGQTPGSPKFPGLADTADLYSIGLKYHIDKQASLYLIGAYLKQDAGAHYGLGAGEGHGAPILSPRTNTGGPLPGQTLSAISTGFQYGF